MHCALGSDEPEFKTSPHKLKCALSKLIYLMIEMKRGVLFEGLSNCFY